MWKFVGKGESMGGYSEKGSEKEEKSFENYMIPKGGRRSVFRSGRQGFERISSIFVCGRTGVILKRILGIRHRLRMR